ncbi:MAG: glucose-6-phosphate isomerase [Clostridia bacterium]|nr:glucose-6-phosphate isomerase [Clostridia bacterium]
MHLKLNDEFLKPFVSLEELDGIEPEVKRAFSYVENENGPGNDFLGWKTLPLDYDKEEFDRIKKCADKIKQTGDVLVVVGIGGSYLGARAAIEFLYSQNYNALKDKTKVYFAGNTLSPESLNEILQLIDGKSWYLNIISKSGTTTEPSIAFRVLIEKLEKDFGKEALSERIIATTDKSRGALKQLCDEKGYETFVIPDNVGGRYSVLTAVGLLPMAVAGIDIDKVMSGAAQAVADFSDDSMNACNKYAAIRNLLYRKDKTVELFVSYEPSCLMLNEWLKQLFGESEGKDEKGIFPAGAIFSTDLHSLGQYIQEGKKQIFETVISYKTVDNDIIIKETEDNSDGLNFLADKKLSEINDIAKRATSIAHCNGGVPVIELEFEKRDEATLGYLFYFFERACGISAYISGVNPFNQPGVESYKKNMFALLGKEGFEELKEKLEKEF